MRATQLRAGAKKKRKAARLLELFMSEGEASKIINHKIGDSLSSLQHKKYIKKCRKKKDNKKEC